MKYNYTRQRQGRDFSIIRHLQHADMDTESERNIDGTSGITNIINETEKKRSITAQLEEWQKDKERNETPIDGYDDIKNPFASYGDAGEGMYSMFSFVGNLDAPDCSEFGSIGVVLRNGGVVRVS